MKKTVTWRRLGMIKLTVNPETHSYTHIFHKSCVIIGMGADLNLAGESLDPVHIKIIEQDERYIIVNQANDPFVTLNGIPFGKKTLKNNDLILIGNTPVLFSSVVEKQEDHIIPAQANLVDTEEKLHTILEQALASKSMENASSQISFPLPLEQHNYSNESPGFNLENELQRLEELAENISQEESWKNEQLPSDLDLEALLRQVEDLEAPPPEMQAESQINSPTLVSIGEAPSPPSYEEKQAVRSSMHQKGSLKDYYLSEFDDETEQMNKSQDAEELVSAIMHRWNWKFISLIAAALIAILFVLFIFFYFSMSDRNNEDELKAAAGVADVAMALTYAQMNHGKPQNQNWSDPEFIKNNLLAALAPKYNPFDNLDSHGQFSNNSYFIRIYTSSDLSHFLVIAQPAPSILHWMIPRASIVVDSKHMEMRKIDDLKTLNRVLLNPNTLDGTNHTEVSEIIQQGELIPLSKVATKVGSYGFVPPKILGSIRPGAENLIYNAPRYYPFGESFLKKALMLSENQGNSQEVTLLQNQLKALIKYPNLILYSPIGMQRAVQAQKALNTFLPQNKLLVAYLKLNSKGMILGSNLLMDDASSEIAVGPQFTPQLEFAPPQEKEQVVGTDDSVEKSIQTSQNNIDDKHPLFLKLCALQTMRQHSQHAFETELAALLNHAEENHSDVLHFLARMELLLKKSLKTYEGDQDKTRKTTATIEFLDKLQKVLVKNEERRRQEEQNLKKSLTKLYEDYSDMPLVDFMGYIKSAGLDDFMQQHLKLQQDNSAASELPQEQIEAQIQKIKASTNLAELNQAVEELAGVLSLEKFPEPAKLILYQTEARLQVLDKLNDFLLSSEKGLSPSEFTKENEARLAQIMKTAWVTDHDEFNFYLNEFEVRQQKQG